MSEIGKINRGLKWYARCRDADGNLLPVVTNNPAMMGDVQAYLDHKKKLEEAKLPAKETKSKGKK